MTSVSRGRPQASSQETLAEAACELFLEQGYEETTVAHITQRAGVSRSTFFNYFDGKAATIWFALDSYLAEAARANTDGSNRPVLTVVAGDLGNAPLSTLALAIANAEAMGVAGELATGRALRQAELSGLFAKELKLETHVSALAAEAQGSALAAAVFAALWDWALRGSGSNSLSETITSAVNMTQAYRADAAPGNAGAAGRTGATVANSDDDGDSQHTGSARGHAEELRSNGNALRVAVIGAGAIGARVIEELYEGNIPGVVLAGVVTRRAGALAHLPFAHEVTDFGEDIGRAIAESDLVVECAGIPGLRAYGPTIIAAGRDLLTVSIGALADPEMRATLTSGPGILRLSNGAIGGLDIVAAAARETGVPGGITAASITSTKKAKALVQSWMSAEEVERLRTTTEAFELFSGTVQEAIALFPGSLNIACALAHASGLWDETFVKLVADPAAERTHHRIEASGAAGDYIFTITNKVSPVNPTSSMIVAESVLSGVETLAGKRGSFV